MKNLLKNRIVVGLACIVLSLAICFGLTPLFNNALTSQVEIVRVSRDIKKGEQITASMLTTVKVGGYNLPVNVMYKAEDVVGQYANTDLYRDDYILATKLSATPMLKNEYLRRLNGANVAISVTIQTFAKGLSGKLEQGDIVSIIAVETGDLGETFIYPELTYMEVITVTTNEGVDGEVQEEQGENEEKELPSTITLIANPRQAVILADLEKNGAIHAALVYRGDSSTAQRYLNLQEQYFVELDEAAAAAEAAAGENAGQAQSSGEVTPSADSASATSQDGSQETDQNDE